MFQRLLFLLLVSANASAASGHLMLPKNMKLPSWNETWVDRLRQNLLLNYDKFSRPSQHFNTTTVFLYLNIKQVDIDSKKSVMSVNTWVRMMWNDEKLKWNSKEYGGVEDISVSAHEIWQPDLVLYNSALYGVENYESRQCIVRQDGTVGWVAPTVLQSFCQLNFKLWPYETNFCRLDLVSWTHNGEEVDIQLHDNGYNLEEYTAGEWKVQKVKARRANGTNICCANDVCCPVIYYEITLTRSSNLHYHVVFVACIPIVFLVLISFWMKPQSEMKLVVIIAAVIIDVLFLQYFGYKIPARPDSLPLIVKFFSGCLCQMTVSIVISGFVIHISTSSYDVSIPRRIRTLLFGKTGKYLGLGNAVYEVEFQKLTTIDFQSGRLNNSDSVLNGVDNNDRQSIITQSERVKRLEWILLATAIDRISFVLFCSIFVFSAIVCFSVSDDSSFQKSHDSSVTSVN